MSSIARISIFVASITFTFAALFAQSKDDDAAKKKPLPPGVTRVKVEFSGGHDTEGVDKGRPVVLIANALGVKPEVFREAFSHVHPAPAGTQPDPEQVRQNKAALMDALGKYGITNDQLDKISNFYRYQRSKGEMWPTKPAVAYALVKDGKVIGYEVESGGAGYSSAPTVGLPNFKDAKAKAELSFGKDLDHNGAVSSITLPDEKQK
ncbi:MAG TPA: hypothetical protein VFE46_19070 [Pirellulales bacterium]|jgi:hypothetical protein|nr:hypothetical protein [Pirellulales bacterium]